MKKNATSLRSIVLYAVLMTLTCATAYSKPESSDDNVYEKLPVKEVTIFKDGHAYVLHEGSLPTDEKGNVVMGQLPKPILGTFWAYSVDKNAKLSCVISGKEQIEESKTPANIEELVKANKGREIIVKEKNLPNIYRATILRMLEENSKMVLLKVDEGIRPLACSDIESVTFLAPPNESFKHKKSKNIMTLNMDWKNSKKKKQANVGMAYVQLGMRWIPDYRIEIDGKGKAIVKLQATIINELVDIEDITAHLVVGVPKFAFSKNPHPISLQETVASLSQHFTPTSSTAYSFDNSIRSQMVTTQVRQPSAPSSGSIDLGPEMNGTNKNEDLFVFTIDHITLKKGQRMVTPLVEYELEYEDIYTLNVSFRPPLEMRRNFNSNQHLQLAREFHAAKAIHKIRLHNKSRYPITTAPATIFKNNTILSQSMTRYTSIGGKGDLEVTTAIDIKVKSTNKQSGMTPNAVKLSGHNYNKIEMQGEISLTNYKTKPVKIEIKRTVLGNIDSADNDGRTSQLGHGYDGMAFEDGLPYWWNWCSWPWWWYHFNSIGKASWDMELEPNKEVKLNYNWHYFWRL